MVNGTLSAVASAIASATPGVNATLAVVNQSLANASVATGEAAANSPTMETGIVLLLFGFVAGYVARLVQTELEQKPQ